jgi:hypothetical protein
MSFGRRCIDFSRRHAMSLTSAKCEGHRLAISCFAWRTRFFPRRVDARAARRFRRVSAEPPVQAQRCGYSSIGSRRSSLRCAPKSPRQGTSPSPGPRLDTLRYFSELFENHSTVAPIIKGRYQSQNGHKSAARRIVSRDQYRQRARCVVRRPDALGVTR